jgi:hypothetical protein
VAIVFLDTSALVRRYDPAEPGTADQRQATTAQDEGLQVVLIQ